jgi:hypothetical protein
MSQRFADDISAGAFCILCHRTGVDDEQVCQLAKLDDAVPIAPQTS